MRAEGTPVLFVNAGNALFKRESVPADKVRPWRAVADLIVSSHNEMRCDAWNVGAYDLSLGLAYLLEKRAEARFPFLSANLLTPEGKPVFEPFLLKEVGGVRVGIFGLIDADLKRDKIPDGDRFRVADPLQTGVEVARRLRSQGADLVILLTDMIGRASRRVALGEAPVDLIVGSDQRNQISLPIVVGNSYLTHLDRGGKSVGRLDLTLSPKGAASAAEGAVTRIGDTRFSNAFVQLRLEIPDHPVVGPRVAKVLQEVSAVQEEVARQASKPDDPECGKEYVGIAACRECHGDRYAHWKETRHAKAYKTLVDRRRQFDGDCVPCHALAFECEGELIDWTALKSFTNVQCEACHGPGSLHVRSGGEERMFGSGEAPGACANCHTPERSPDFEARPHLRAVCAPGP